MKQKTKLFSKDAKDYLKILHALLKEEWIAKEHLTHADNEVILL